MQVEGRLEAQPRPADAQLEHGIPLLVDQLVKTLRLEHDGDPEGSVEIGEGAAQHGFELLRRGVTVDQVVHDYGDLCQAITDLAFERGTPITASLEAEARGCLFAAGAVEPGLAVDVEANLGVLRVRDVPGSGCVFVIDLLRHAAPTRASGRVSQRLRQTI